MGEFCRGFFAGWMFPGPFLLGEGEFFQPSFRVHFVGDFLLDLFFCDFFLGEGKFFRAKFPGAFCGGFFGGFLLCLLKFSLSSRNQKRKHPPENPQQNSNRNCP